MLDTRMKVLLKNVFGSAAARFVNLFITLAMVPLTINALSPTDYAYFAMAISLSVLATYADLGMGLAVVNVIAERGTRPKSLKAQRAVSVVWFTLLGIAALGISLVLLLAAWVNFGLASDSTHQYNAMLLAAGCVFAGLPTGLVQRVLFAEQKNIQANAWSTGARLLSLVTVWILVVTGNANLLMLVLAVIGVPLGLGWISVYVIFGNTHMSIFRPTATHYDIRLLRPYLLVGMSFLIMQLVPYVETGFDTILIGKAVNINLVPAFDVYSKLFTYVPALVSIGAFPLWPAIANAKIKGEISWIVKARKWSYLVVGVLSIASSTFFFVFSFKLLTIWTGKELILPSGAILAMALFAILTCIGTVQTMILSGVGIIKGQLKIYSYYILVLISFKLFAAFQFGLSAMLWVLNIIYIMRLCLAEHLMNKIYK